MRSPTAKERARDLVKAWGQAPGEGEARLTIRITHAIEEAVAAERATREEEMGDYVEEARGICALTPMDRSLGDFARAVRVCIEEEQRKIAPQTHVIALLCDALRLGAEYISAMKGSLRTAPLASAPAEETKAPHGTP